MRVERSIDLPCSIETAWTVLTDWEAQASWMRDADRVVVVSPQRTGVGVRLAVRTRLLGIPAFTEPLEVIRWDRPRSLAVRHGGPVRGEGTWVLETMGPGRTRFTWIEDVALGIPWIGRAVAWCYRPMLRTLMGRAQVDLRRAIARGRS